MSPFAGRLTAWVRVGVGAVPRPSTLWPPTFASAWLPNPNAAFVSTALRIVPPFKVRAFAPTLTPSASTSTACTRYSNVRVAVPLPLE